MRPRFLSSISGRILLAIVSVSLVPMVVLGGLTLRTTVQAGDVAVERSSQALDAKATEALELRAVETARAMAGFLRGREQDLRALAGQPRTAESYLAFADAYWGELWLLEQGREARRLEPLYREIAFVGASGREVVKVLDGRLAGPDELRDVGDPANTLYRSETYFREAGKLAPGQVYVGRVTGFHVSQAEFAAGKRFRGVLRFATPVFDRGGRFDGVVVLALDSRHLSEFTAHIVPTEQRFAAAPDPATGNYAYVVDTASYAIAHPNDFLNYGVRENGEPVPHATRPEEIGPLPVKVDQLGFADENLASIPGRVVRGEAGSIQYVWTGRSKFVAFAPIPYYGGAYAPPVGFGWVAIGADVDAFHRAATRVGMAVRDEVGALVAVMLAILAASGVAVVATGAAVVSRTIVRRLLRLDRAARRLEKGELELQEIETLRNSEGEDEVASLMRVFARMAVQVRAREEELRQQVEELNIEIDQSKKAKQVAEITESDFFQQLQSKVKDLRTAHTLP